jgi:hypothetical protein
MNDVDADLGGAAPAVETEKPFVRLPTEGWPLSNFAREVGGILAGDGIFRREDVVVTVNRERGVMVEMASDRFRTYVERHCRPARFVWQKDDPVPVKREMTMSSEVARGTLASDEFVQQQRPLIRTNLVPSPVWRASGAIELLPSGYDAESQTFTVGTPGVDVRADMPKEEALAALDDLLREFPFSDLDQTTGLSRSKAVHVAAMLSVYAPGLLPLVAARPGVLWIANAPRTGKTLLGKTVQIPVFGTAAVTPMKTEEEFDKVLDTAAIEAWPVLFLDNLTGLFKSPALDAFMTSPTRRARTMNSQRSFAAPRTTQVLLTGNNLSLSEDLEERFLICDLYLEEMDPRSRKIDRRIDEAWLARPDVRSRILSALWALVRDWDQAGRPRSTAHMPGFEDWAEIYGGIVEHAGFGSPLERPKLAYGGDDAKRDLMAMLEALADDVLRPDPAGNVVRSKEYTFDELVECCRSLDCFTGWIDGREVRDKDREPRFELSPKTRSRLGKYFSAQFGGRIGTLSDGRRVRFGQRGRQRHHRYIVEVL